MVETTQYFDQHMMNLWNSLMHVIEANGLLCLKEGLDVHMTTSSIGNCMNPD